MCSENETNKQKLKKKKKYTHTTIVALRGGGGAPAAGVQGRRLDEDWCASGVGAGLQRSVAAV